MAENDMDVVVEHGLGHDIEDDIMGDILLEENNNEDEDRMLFDFVGNADISSVDQPPGINDDANMVDDEEQELNFHVHDEAMEEGIEHGMEDEAPSQSFVIAESPSYAFLEEGNDVTTIVGENVEENRVPGPSRDNAAGGPVLADLPPGNPEIQSQHQNNVTEENLEGNSVLETPNIQRSPSPVYSLHEETDGANPENPDFIPHEPDSHTPSSADGKSAGFSVEDGPEGASPENAEAHEAELSFGLQTLSVTYHDAEYRLFGSIHDDPDTFFLTDYSIADKPISEFFSGIREIIHEDITDEDELCIFIEHFGLSIEETVCSLHDVTMAQLLELHEKFLENEEGTEIRSLHILLTARPSFARRLANLTAGAADGKKLYELVSLDQYKSQDGESGGVSEVEEHIELHHSEEGDEDANLAVHDMKDGYGQAIIDHVEDSTYSDDREISEDPSRFVEENHENPGSEFQETFDDLAADLLQSESIQPFSAETNRNFEGTSALATSINEKDDGLVPPETENLTSFTDQGREDTTEQNSPHESFEGEADLLDYSEDEQEDSGTSTDKEAKHAENESFNEEWRRRSLSHASEGKVQSDVVKVEDTHETADHTQQELHNQQGPDQGDAGFADEDYLDLGAEQAEQQEDISHGQPNSEDFQLGEDVDETAKEEQSTIENQEENNHESGNGQFEALPEESWESPEGEIPIDWATTNYSENVVEDDYLDHEETAGSSATLSTGDVQQEELINIKQNASELETDTKDEIDYDDDDYSKDVESLGQADPASSPKITNGGAGKRLRRDSDDGSTVSDNDFKRVKS